MSDSTGLIAISFFGIVGCFLCPYISNLAAELNGQILTGVIRGTPISIRARRSLLYLLWVPYQTMGAIGMLFVALVETWFADQIADADIKLLAYGFAFISLCACLLFLSNGIFGALKYKRYLLRLEETEP
jgi:hypothetical protein